ncbi:hypothetical protein VY88_28650 [Azospirillum thiophilum]|uniref:DUF6916 domain-containing protein n=1 Tax=Azospirillum thiophilum TaxID=528244 RepID=A0AAC8ZWF1_9PROT|nr:hypothetical protein [Azospirillum thiophilum]ALG75563.1 hypothetical protein AL072_31975 [Azospirillum thiophilum]KJR62084.1 hypothetical protein VY88_28650 [Azospirillum thiophilum]
MTELRALSAALFGPHLNTVFTMVSEEGLEIAATLVACNEHPRNTMRGTLRTAFDLLLECPAEEVPHFNGASFTIGHPAVESFGPVYVERINPATPAGADTAVFQIIFN